MLIKTDWRMKKSLENPTVGGPFDLKPLQNIFPIESRRIVGLTFWFFPWKARTDIVPELAA